jgi:charged multivesicular body protein 2A
MSDLKDSVKIMARDLVRTRQYVKKFIMMKANIQAVSLKVQTLKSQDAMAEVQKYISPTPYPKKKFVF